MPKPPATRRAKGRPRGFESREAVEAAMVTFWAQGYDGTSIDTLCRATRMPRASLYQTYGSKQGLFLASIEHYVETRISRVVDALGPKGSLESDLAAFFAAVVDLATGDETTRGCLISCVLADSAGSSPELRDELDRRFSALEAKIRARLDLEPWSGAVSRAATAGVLAAVARGIMLRARSGRGGDDLREVAAAAVAAATRCAA